jgi:hypothetical protein
MEERGLSWAEPGARPGDICTRAAVPNRDAALDITIASQEAGSAGRDCVSAAYRRKLHRYRDTVAEWEGTTMVFQPLVWSHEGRSHVSVQHVMKFCAGQIARRHSCQANDILKRWKGDLGVALAVRRARMAARCLPRASARDQYVVGGAVGDDAEGHMAAGGSLAQYAAGLDGEVDASDSEADGGDIEFESDVD